MRPFSRGPLDAFRVGLLLGAVGLGAASSAFGSPVSRDAGSTETAPLAGILRGNGAPLAGVTLVIRRLSGATSSLARLVKTEADGTFCWSDAPAGVYSIFSTVPGFRPSVRQVLHRSGRDAVSFVGLDLERDRRGILPSGPGGALDPWTARAAVEGDVLRDLSPAAAPATTPPAPEGLAPSVLAQREQTTKIPVTASVRSLHGFGGEGERSVTQTALDVEGTVAGSVRWGIAGAYNRITSPEGDVVGDASNIAIDVTPGSSQRFHASSRLQSLEGGAPDESSFGTHAVGWSGSTGERSRASVLARVVSQRNLDPASPAVGVALRPSSAFEVAADYQTDLDPGRFVRFVVGYRAEDDRGPGGPQLRPLRETRVGGVAGVRVVDGLFLEGGGTGDFSDRSRGVTPELTVRLTGSALTLYGFASRRFESRLDEGLAPLYVGIDTGDLTRATQSLYRAGLRLAEGASASVDIEGSRRELRENVQLVLNPDFIDHVDALYLFAGDVADEVAGRATFRIGEGVPARLAVQYGRIEGDGVGGGALHTATYVISSGSVEVGPTGTSLLVRYRLLDQQLSGNERPWVSAVQAVDFSVAQDLPIPALAALGSRWRALFSLELGTRHEGSDEIRTNRRLAGGLSVSF